LAASANAISNFPEADFWPAGSLRGRYHAEIEEGLAPIAETTERLRFPRIRRLESAGSRYVAVQS
jgi:hypothetical protein